MEDYINPGSKEVYLFNLNYTKMMEALGFAFSTGQISSTENESTLCEEVEKVIEVQTNMIENSVFSEFYSRKFGYAMDKAQTYRIAGRRDLCLDELNSIAGWVESEEDEADVQSFQCMVSLEKDFIEGTVPFDSGDIDEFMTACENSSANQRVRRETVLNKQESQIQTLKMEVILSPVPAKNLLNIITNVENGNIVMTNAFGQVVNKMPINYGITFDVSTLSRGIYFLTFADEISFERKVLRVILQ